DELDPEAGVVVFKNGDFAAADDAAIDHDLDGFADAAVERDRGALGKVHEAGDLHLRGTQHDLQIDRDIHDEVEVGLQRAARPCRFARLGAKIAAAEIAAAAEIRTAEAGAGVEIRSGRAAGEVGRAEIATKGGQRVVVD